MGIDQYPGEMRIVRELIQNADDAEANYFEIHQNKNELLIVHDGIPFTKPTEVETESKSDFIRISRIGLG
ncbi:MAG: hypothetical protein OEZ44_07380, partial [Candidatus Bathyarchaeota archaeon]|nr:hypothetical protein [Candidatus Bathyarchaeota archaeon]